MVLGQGINRKKAGKFLKDVPSKVGGMLARTYSLKGEENFEKVEKEGKIIQLDSFGLVYLKREDFGVPRFGFIVSQKVSKDAVQRNRIKRALSEAVRLMVNDTKKGYDVVFLARPESARRGTDVLMRETQAAFVKAKLFESRK